ncbi:MAG: cysteine desulfurase [Planctomycetes bacterium]|nr:cysteine desulfurase [Planctomycetota bacterium]
MPQPATPLERYFDTNGSTPLADPVRALARTLLEETYGNASAPHPEGRAARALVETARAQVAALLGCAPGEVIFTSGGTESNNHALFGTAALRPGAHLVVSSIEHKSVLQSARALERRGHPLTLVAPRGDGAVHVRDVEAALRPDTALVSLMWSNNETGIVQPVREVAALCREREVRFHTDAVCTLGKLPVDVREVACDLLSLSGHKLYAPKGIGVLYRRAGVALEPLLHGCGHQDGQRSGTENTLAIAGFGLACELQRRGELAPVEPYEALRRELWEGIQRALPAAQRNGAGGSLPNTLSVWFPGAPAARVQARLAADGFSVAAGAAASTGAPSHVLVAMGHTPARASESLRFSLGRHTTRAAVSALLEHLLPAVEACRDEAAALA